MINSKAGLVPALLPAIGCTLVDWVSKAAIIRHLSIVSIQNGGVLISPVVIRVTSEPLAQVTSQLFAQV